MLHNYSVYAYKYKLLFKSNLLASLRIEENVFTCYIYN